MTVTMIPVVEPQDLDIAVTVTVHVPLSDLRNWAKKEKLNFELLNRLRTALHAQDAASLNSDFYHELERITTP